MSRAAQILSLGSLTPRVHDSAFIAGTLIGDVEVGPRASVWYGCVLRGDVNRIVSGAESNIQDGTVIHTESDSMAQYKSGAAAKSETGGEAGGAPTLVGAGVTVGHLALLHACTIGDGALVGMGAIVMDGAVVEAGAFLAAGALLPPGKRVPRGELWGGRPARHMRTLRAAEAEMLAESARRYVALAARYKEASDE